MAVFDMLSAQTSAICGHRVDGDDGVEIHPPKAAGGKGYLATLQSLLQQVPSVLVQGIPSVERAVVEKKTKEDGRLVSRPCGCTAPTYRLLQ